MTDLNKHNPYPDAFTIRCPGCGGPAEFRFAFTLVGKNEKSPFEGRMWPTAETTEWGGWRVIQHDPKLYSWKPPPRGYQRSDEGIYACDRCIGRFKHTLDWPHDAYYRFEVREGLLWAWTLSHAEALADYIESMDRKPERHKHFLFLRHIPAVFLQHGSRERIARCIRKEIGRAAALDKSGV